MRSRGSFLPRARCRSRAAAPPPSRMAATFSTRSATAARIASALARNASDRGSTALLMTGIRHHAECRLDRAREKPANGELASWTRSFDFAQDEVSFPSVSPLVLSEVEGQGRRPELPPMLTLAQLEAAADLVHSIIPPTPQLCWPLLAERCGTEVWV